MSSADFSNLGKHIRSLLFRRRETMAAGGAAAPDSAAADSPDPAGALTAGDFAAHLRTIANDHGQVAVGRLQVLGFHSIRDRLGERWTQMQANICEAIEGTFRRRLGPRDVFRGYGELVYLVIFADLTAEEARVKAHFIAEEIWQQLFGMDEQDNVMDVSMLTINLETNQVEEVADLDTLLVQHFEKAARDAAACQPGSSAPPAASQTILSYTPLWLPQRNAVSSYYARMCLIDGAKGVYFGHDILRRTTAPRETYEFDMITLARVQAAALRLHERRAPAVLVCPVHYTTLVNRVARLEYLEQCAGLTRAATRHIILEVGGLAEGFPPHTAFEICLWLKPYSRSVTALVPPTAVAVHNLKEAGFAAIGFDARHLGPAHRLASIATQFVEAARRHRMRAFIHGLVTPEAVATAAGAGFDILSGDAIQRPFPKVLAPYRLTLEQIMADHQ